jgi:hypothetical protein
MALGEDAVVDDERDIEREMDKLSISTCFGD